MNHPALTLRSIGSRAIAVPMRRPLGTSGARMATAPFVLVDVETEEGISGRAHAFCYLELAASPIRSVLAALEERLVGRVVDPPAISREARAHFILLGTPGVVGTALSALDVACWDALSRAAGQPLARYLGGTATSVPAYNSNGLSLTDPAGLADEALALLDPGFDAVKIRLGRASAAEDLSAVRSVRRALPASASLMSDYNQALSVEDGIERCAALDDEGLYWIEEPLAYDDLVGYSRLAAAVETPIQGGENFGGPAVLDSALALHALDYAMVDLMRIGGVTGWLAARAVAESASLPLSSHLYPEVSAHLLAATPTSHWLEYVDWAEPFLTSGVSIAAGKAQISGEPGTGVDWDEGAVTRFAVE